MSKTVLYTNDSQAKPAKFYILDKTGNISEIPVKDKMTIGRFFDGSTVDLPLNSSVVSKQHGEIAVLDGEYFYRDLLSTNGTYINGKLYGKSANKGRSARKLEDGDVLRFNTGDDASLDPETVIMIFSTNYEDNFKWFTQLVSNNIAELNIGRDTAPNSGMRIEDEMVSQNHASFFAAEQGWAIIDHESTNGVFINNQRISEPEYLKKYDIVRIINFNFIYMADKIFYQSPVSASNPPISGNIPPGRGYSDTPLAYAAGISGYIPGAVGAMAPPGVLPQLRIHIAERSVWQKFKKLTLLQNINLVVNPNEMVLILGGSGAGKTTFMNAVMGYEKADGKIFHGNRDIYRDYESMKFEIGFVPQQDLLRGSDKVYETLNNAARMKLPKHINEAMRDQRIHEVMNLLGLVREKNSLVSKLSGGQRKRLSIAVEYIADPSLFFLDEPDSGLDGIMAKSLSENLRTIADTGKIIMVITHSPDRVAHLYDKVIVLAKSTRDNCGRLAYYGSISDAKTFFETDSLEGVVKRINRPDEGGDGLSDFYIEKYMKQ